MGNYINDSWGSVWANIGSVLFKEFIIIIKMINELFKRF